MQERRKTTNDQSIKQTDSTTMAGKGKQFLSTPPPTSITQRPSPLIPTREQVEAKRKLIPKNRALADANKAELIAMDLLSLCADTTRHFEAMARGDETVPKSDISRGGSDVSKRMRGADGIEKKPVSAAAAATTTRLPSSDSMDSTTSSNSNSSSDNEEKDRMALIRKNGIKFQNALKKIHELLAPHASLVVNYTQEDNQIKRKNDKQGEKEEILTREDSQKGNLMGSDANGNVKDEKVSGDATSSSSTAADGVEREKDDKDKGQDQDKEMESKKKGDTSQRDESMEHHNMYYSRLEKKLAIDRRNLIKDMLRLEKQLLQCGKQEQLQTSKHEGSDQVDSICNNKRKRQD